MMKIAFLVKRLDMGGIGSLMIRLSEILSKDHDVTIITTEGNGLLDQSSKVRLKKFDFWYHKDPVSYLKCIADYINNEAFDAVFLNDSLWGTALLEFLEPHIRRISVLHAMDDSSISVSVSNVEQIDGYIAVSPKIKRILRELRLNNVYLVPNGIDKDFFDANHQNKEFKKQLNLLFCGRISHRDKGALFLPKLVELFINDGFQSLKLIVLGDGPDRKRLEAMLNEKRLKSYVELKGSVTKENVIHEIKKAHFLIFPSLSEGFGLSLIEAQGLGCIPAAFNIEGVTDYIIEDNVNGLLCEFGNIEDMYHRLRDAIIEEERIRQLSEAAKKNAERFRLEDTAREWIQMVTSVPEKKESRAGSVNKAIDILSTSFSKEIETLKRKWLYNYYQNSHGNFGRLIEMKAENVVIFGTKHMAYFIYMDLVKNNMNTIRFIDNFGMGESTVCGIGVNDESWLLSNRTLYDAVIISVESDSRKEIKKMLSVKIPGKPIFEWTELLKTK